MVVAFLVAVFIPEKTSCSSSSSQLALGEKPHADGKEPVPARVHAPVPGSEDDNPPAANHEDFEPLLQDSVV